MAHADDLERILQAYADAEPSRARGGIVALTGFQYQIWCYLADYLQALAANNPFKGGIAFVDAFEALSDYTRATRQGAVCVQVKHYLDASALGEAAVEIAAIERFFTSYDPVLQEHVSYEVVAQGGRAPTDWDRVRLPSKVRVKEPELEPYFERARAANRVKAPRFEPDPQWKCISEVFGKLDDPFGFVRTAYERCMRRTRNAYSAVSIRSEIAEDYTARLMKRRLVGRTLAETDFQSAVSDGTVPVGRTPTLADVRGGRLMHRPERVSEVLLTLDVLQQRANTSDEPAIPMLWISGPSGSGKSVVLLQVMQQLIIQRKASVLWFTNRVNELGTALEQIASHDDAAVPEYLFVDDIYDPQSRESFDIPRITQHVVHGRPRRWPLIVTCGPTEFRQDFERDSRSEGFALEPFHLGTLKASEISQLQAWYRSRTGRTATLRPAAMADRGLMISLMFELAHGDLRPFAARFQTRLSQDGLDDALSVPLALNRLYIWTPRNWLTNEEQAKLERINQDGDFSILSLDEPPGPLLRLTHPHLSDAIYRAVHPENAPTTFARHLEMAFTKALASHTPTVLRLLRVVAANAERLAIADQATLVKSFTRAWNECDERSLVESIDAWVSWTRWARRVPAVAKALREDPLSRAILLLRADSPRWVTWWLELWSVASSEPRLQQAALSWLTTHISEIGWSPVWSRLIDRILRRHSLADDETVRTLIALGWRRLQVQDSTGWRHVWDRMIKVSVVTEGAIPQSDLESIALERLSGRPDVLEWNALWLSLVALSKSGRTSLRIVDVYHRGAQWLTKQLEHPGWPFVWQELASADQITPPLTPELFDSLGERWKAENEGAPGWLGVAWLLAVRRAGDERRNATDALVAWTEAHAYLPNWGGLWHFLFELQRAELSPEQERRLFVAAYKWLLEDDTRNMALFVWRHVFVNSDNFKDAVDSDRLLAIGSAILSRLAEGDDPEWSNAWSTLFSYAFQLTEGDSGSLIASLREGGCRWVAVPRHQHDASWSQVYRGLHRATAKHEQWFRELGITAAMYGSQPDAASLAALVVSDDTFGEPSDSLILWFADWLAGRARHSGGFSVWQRIMRSIQASKVRSNSDQWMKLTQVLNKHRPSQADSWNHVVDCYKNGTPVRGRVVKTVLKKGGRGRDKRLGYVVDIGVNAFLRVEHAGLKSKSPSERLSLVGQECQFTIDRLDEERLQVDVKRITAVSPADDDSLFALEAGAVVTGRITGVVPYGVFVDIGSTIALLHITEIPGDHAAVPLTTQFRIGQTLVARILSTDKQRRRIGLTLNETPPTTLD
jgi:hypothetical protein